MFVNQFTSYHGLLFDSATVLQGALKPSHSHNMEFLEFSNVFENIILNSKISRFNFVKAGTLEILAFPTHLIGISWFLTALRKSLYTLPVKKKESHYQRRLCCYTNRFSEQKFKEMHERQYGEYRF